MSHVALPTTWQFSRQVWHMYWVAGPHQCWRHRRLVPQPSKGSWSGGLRISIFPGRKWSSKGPGNLFKVRQLVEARTGILNPVSSPNQCRMLLPKVTGKCDKEGMGCHSPPLSHRYCRRCPDAGGRARIQGFMGPRNLCSGPPSMYQMA